MSLHEIVDAPAHVSRGWFEGCDRSPGLVLKRSLRNWKGLFAADGAACPGKAFANALELMEFDPAASIMIVPDLGNGTLWASESSVHARHLPAGKPRVVFRLARGVDDHRTVLDPRGRGPASRRALTGSARRGEVVRVAQPRARVDEDVVCRLGAV